MRKVLAIMALFVVSLLVLPLVSAVGQLPIEIQKLKIDGNTVEDENLYVEEGKTIKIQVKVENTGVDTAEDIEVEAAFKGYEYSNKESVSDSTHVFDLDAGDTRWVDLKITLPKKLDKDLYLLRLRVTDKNSESVTETYNIKMNPKRHSINIKDVVFSPGTTVQAGYSLLTTVLVDNNGGKDEQDVKVTLDISELGVSASDYISGVDSSDKKTSEELFLRIPICAKAGTYDAKVTLTYDESYETVSKSFKLTVLANDKCAPTTLNKLILTVGPESQKVTAGQRVSYPVILTNAGTSSQTYVLELTTGTDMTGKMSESLVVLAAGKSKVVYAYLTSGKETSGQKVATLAVKSGSDVLKTIYLKADVTKQDSMSLRNGLEIALIVLVVVLVIIGLILGFSRLRKDRDEEELEEGDDKTYY